MSMMVIHLCLDIVRKDHMEMDCRGHDKYLEMEVLLELSKFKEEKK
jgi:hypothetical protein